MKRNNHPTPGFPLLYILVFMVVLPGAAQGLTIIPNDIEMIVMPLVLLLFLLAALLLVRIIKKHNRQVAGKLQLLEEQYLQPGCPEDALLATQNILLAAHCVGLGTCLVGYAVAVMRRERRVCRFAGLPDNETPYAVIALGYPDERYASMAGRRRMTIRYYHKTR